MERRKLISIVTPCFNEALNVEELYARIRATMQTLSDKYDYEHIIVDNASTDRTVEIAKQLASTDRRLKIIVNARNFGPVRSPYYGIVEAFGDAVILLAADLQDPPELIVEYVKKWEEGFDVVMPTKAQSEESMLMQRIRKTYYRMLNSISEVPLEEHATGAGLYDKRVIDTLRKLSDPYPYFRGLVCDLGFSRCTVNFLQPVRKRGVSKANFYGMFDQALLAMTKHSKLPLRLMTFLGLGLGLLSLFASFVFFVLKLLFWNSFNMGIAPLLVGLFFLASMQFFFLGILGEYIGMILTQVRNMPLVIEKERINFGED
ncbi:glycosyltransferase family 2 protein [Paraburkholderia mimosarum]|uniref:glycosyltransferase family 2 protein n=1 Tax=Paraburkholderia mimosarum TaxID=312026 RepID=UPI0039C3FBBA